MISDSQQSFKDFVQNYAVRQYRTVKKNSQKIYQESQRSNYESQIQGIQIEQNLSYAITNRRVSNGDPQMHLRFKEISSTKTSRSELPLFTIKQWSQKKKPLYLIRNSQLFNDVIRKATNQSSQQQLIPIKSQDQIIKSYLHQLSVKRKVAPKPQGTEDVLNFEVDQIYFDITRKDTMLSPKFPNKNHNGIKQVFRNLLATAYDQQMFLDLTRLRVVHIGMQLTHAHFFKFKYHFLNRFMLLNIPTEKMFNSCEKIENMRPYVLNEILEYEIYGGEEGIQAITKSMYKKILSDVTLAPYFEKIDVATQEIKFARLFFQLIYHLDSPNYSCETLRERHVKYALTNVQLTNFKYYLSLTLQEANIPWKNIRQLLRRMDIYKYAIINKKDLQYYVNQMGFHQFIDNFINSCQQDTMLSDLIIRRGKQRFTAHCCNIFHYFFRYNIKAITREDLHLIHSKKAIINERIFEKLKQKAIQEVKLLTNDTLIIEDFKEDWDEIKPIILGEARNQLILNLGEDYLIQKAQSILEYEFAQRHLNQIYETEEANMNQSILCKLNLLLYGVRFFKKQDLQIIHKRFKITYSQYYDFQQSFKVALEDYKILDYVHQLIEEYEQYIVSD
ncbi:unnamed protein product [Paramecium pentaurelia]|uniref:Uncharacterized protein n=1 Tax=Paramecium pentaurelia TaxID=43138 RepID=A0A8S1WK52_9CILI|nr:unnamed protein product [Paramecium pentaurelia]